MPADVLPQALRIAYFVVCVPLILVLLFRGALSGSIRILLLVLTLLFGLILILPLAPLQLQSLLLGNMQGPAVTIIAIIVIFSILAFLVGRIFCGYLCPIGAIQELAFEVPVKKVHLVHRNLLFILRLLILFLFFTAALFLSFGVLHVFGIREFFYPEYRINSLFRISRAAVRIALFLSPILPDHLPTWCHIFACFSEADSETTVGGRVHGLRNLSRNLSHR